MCIRDRSYGALPPRADFAVGNEKDNPSASPAVPATTVKEEEGPPQKELRAKQEQQGSEGTPQQQREDKP
eukprot:703010-Prorocentrum_lima.AAC.1